MSRTASRRSRWRYVAASLTESQYAVCARYGVVPVPAEPHLNVGLAREVRTGAWPLHGLRHPPGPTDTGWYLWAGDWSEDADFFEPLHVSHLDEIRPEVVPFLALPPGSRFLLAPDYQDVWEDRSLLDI